MEIGSTKEEFVVLWKQAVAKKEALEAEFDTSSDVVFYYGYG